MDASSTQRDYYEILGVDRKATRSEIHRAYRRRALELHPDNNREHPDEAQRQFQELLEAFEVLYDPFERECYDAVTGRTDRPLTPQELARLGVATAGQRTVRRADEPDPAHGGRHPGAWSIAAALLGVASLPLAVWYQTAALVAGVGGMAAASRALSAVGTFRLPLLNQRLAQGGRFFALFGIAMATTAWGMQAAALVLSVVAGHVPRAWWPQLREMPHLAILWVCLTLVAFAWASASRGQFSRERQRWREYRFLFGLLMVGLVAGLGSNLPAVSWAWRYYAFLEMGPRALYEAMPDVNAPAVALRTALDSTWKVGLVLGLAVLGANSPGQWAPQLPYGDMTRRLYGPLGMIAATMFLGAAFGAVGFFGETPYGHPALDQPGQMGAMAGWGMHLGEFLGVCGATVWVVYAVVTDRRHRARVLRHERAFNSRLLLPRPGEAAT
jgi:hypothetical protein